MRAFIAYSESNRLVIRYPDIVKKIERPRKPPWRRSSWNASITIRPSARSPSSPGWYFKRPSAIGGQYCRDTDRSRVRRLAETDLALRDFAVVHEVHERAPAVAAPRIE